jgi:hypothetical protein
MLCFTVLFRPRHNFNSRLHQHGVGGLELEGLSKKEHKCVACILAFVLEQGLHTAASAYNRYSFCSCTIILKMPNLHFNVSCFAGS